MAGYVLKEAEGRSYRWSPFGYLFTIKAVGDEIGDFASSTWNDLADLATEAWNDVAGFFSSDALLNALVDSILNPVLSYLGNVATCI